MGESVALTALPRTAHLERTASTDDDDRRFPYWRVNSRVVPLSTLLSSLGFALAWPFLPLMLRSLGVESGLELWVGNLVLMFYAVSFLMNPIWGGVADHYGRKIMVLRASVGMGTFMVLAGFATTPLAFALLLFCVGVFNGNSGAGNALIVANTPPARMGMALSLTQMGILVGQTLGPAVGVWLAPMVAHLNVLFCASGGTLLFAGALVAIFVREVKQLAPGRWRLQWLGPLRELLAAPKLAPLFVLSFLFSLLWNGNVTIMSLYMIRLVSDQGLGAEAEAWWIGAVALALAVAGFVAMPLWGRAFDRYSPARILTFATAAAALTHVPLLFLQTPLELVLARAAFEIGRA